MYISTGVLALIATTGLGSSVIGAKADHLMVSCSIHNHIELLCAGVVLLRNRDGYIISRVGNNRPSDGSGYGSISGGHNHLVLVLFVACGAANTIVALMPSTSCRHDAFNDIGGNRLRSSSPPTTGRPHDRRCAKALLPIWTRIKKCSDASKQ